MKATILTLTLATALSASAQQMPWQDPTLPIEQRADDLLSRLTLEEKTQLMMNGSPAIERLGIHQFDWWSEALHGVGRNGTSTVFPITMGMAASFDDALVQDVFTAVSDEARVKAHQAKHGEGMKRYHSLSFWTPNINIFRDPRWGRGQETYGEDPFLTSRMGVAVVRGLQGPDDAKHRKLLACAKHFAVHSGPEWNRHTFNVEDLPERDLWETYLPAFKALVQEAGVEEIMCAYQRVDGEPCCAQTRYEQQILRDEWGFKGLITSDCGAIRDFLPNYHHVVETSEHASAIAVRAGTDVECGSEYKNLPEAVRKGLISERDIDTSLRRLLIGRLKLGDFDPDDQVEWTKIPESVVASKEHRQLALQIAREGIVLLQNNGILPLKSSNSKSSNSKIVVMGPNANDSVMQWGNYNGFPVSTVTLLQGIRNALGKNIRYVPGCPLTASADGDKAADGTSTPEQLLAEVGKAEVVIFCGGISPRVEGEEMKVSAPGFKGGDRTTIELPQPQRDVVRALHEAGKRIIFLNCSGGAVALTPESQLCDAILQVWYGGEQGGQAVADVLTGRYNPSGRLPVTFYKDDSQLPDFLDYRMTNRTYRYFQGEPLYPFGHGLSYTTFEYSGLKATGTDVEVTVKNTGRRDGTEVVQVYLRRPADSDGPQKTLCGYQRVNLKAGERRTVTISLPRERFEVWDATTNTMRVVPGDYQLMVGSSSANQNLQVVTVTI
ncbi:MAG: glycoside hydrolase family 3 C-terminal domain-containing protein [Prevotella sp.]|nr:glycoside hydrolase family 3 C-terminal domain-containing protein [Prevotella sp.]